MELWHFTPDAARTPLRVGPGEAVQLRVGTWPIAPGQSVWAAYSVERPDGIRLQRVARGRWAHNDRANSYWEIDLGRFHRGDHVTYTVLGEGEPGAVLATPARSFRVGAKLYLALLWHQHQPVYADPEAPSPVGSLRQPWVRLHALRDYYSMASLLALHPGVHLTINLTPALLRQLAAYLARGATDRALELTLRPAETLTEVEREEVLSTFFEASWHHQILVHPRYAELFRLRAQGMPFEHRDLRDLQMWFSLAWFNPEFHDSDQELPTGETVRVARYVEQGRGFSHADIEQMVREQYKVLRAVVPMHRALQDRGQLEISTSPLYHPIVPLLIDTDAATLDRPGTSLPRRFAHPEDAVAQIAGAIGDYVELFGRAPRGMWPPEGGVSAEAARLFASHELGWIASDQGVLERSGRFGYAAGDPDVLCRAYRVETDAGPLSIFFRDHDLSDAIGFSLQHHGDPELAAHELARMIRERFVRRFASDEDRVLTLVLDGENPWGSYVRAGRPFLSALYRLLERDADIETVTFAEYLHGDPQRNLAPHPVAEQPELHQLYTGSWIDELGSRTGVDLGTWIGEDEENLAWELLGDARDALAQSGATPESNPAAYDSLWIAEGSDWYWWFGSDQDSGRNDEFDALFRARLRHVWRALGLTPPPDLDHRFVAVAVPWSFAKKLARVAPGDRLLVRTNCPGVLEWQLDDGERQSVELAPIGGVMAGVTRYQHVLGPLPRLARELRFTFRCANVHCDRTHPACRGEEQVVAVSDVHYRRRAPGARESGYAG